MTPPSPQTPEEQSPEEQTPEDRSPEDQTPQPPEPADRPPAGTENPAEKRSAARKLAALLESLPADERQEITAWLLGEGRIPGYLMLSAPPVPVPPVTTIGPLASVSRVELTGRVDPVTALGRHEAVARLRAGLAGALPVGEDSQLITIRLPAERHAQLRAWCAEHAFTMAAVVRGLVERFLEERGPGVAPTDDDERRGAEAPAT